MFKLFSGGAGEESSWPVDDVVAALKQRFSGVDKLGEDGPLKVYGVQDNGVNFVVALMQTAPGSGQVAELGFLARFIGFPATPDLVEKINRNLHISVASIENDDLFLMAGLQVVGAFDETQFNLIIEAWRRDLALCLHGISGDRASMAEVFPAAKLEAARNFAANRAPASGGRSDTDMLSTFLGAKRASRVICEACGGRGKRGFFAARTCEVCGGAGFVERHR